MKNIARATAILLLGVLIVRASAAQNVCIPQESLSTDSTEPVVNVAVLRRNDANGERMWEAVERACADSQCSDEPRIVVHSCGYDLEPDGFRTLQQEILAGTSANYHIVIGPSDSGVLLRAREALSPNATEAIPVVSPTVIAPGGSADVTNLAPINSSDSAFFSLNVSAERRAEAVVNFLLRHSVENIAVLYSDTVFGRLSEAALRARIQGNGIDGYAAYRFAHQAEAQQALPQILSDRPAAIGVLGLRTEISGILDDFQQRNSSWNVYRPFLFTVIDVRELRIPNLYFATVSQDESLDYNDNYSLTYDTMELVVRLIRRNSTSATFDSSGFKEDLLDVLRGPPENPGLMSGMQFNSYLNQAPLRLGRVESEDSSGEASFAPVKLRNPMTFAESIRNTVDVRLRRFGPKMLINIALVGLIVAYLSVLDIQKWYAGTKSSVLRRWPFWILLMFNLATAFLLYAYLAEYRDIRWHHSLEAVVVAFGYAALLKSTVFQTQTGQAIGLGKLYDDAVGWLNDQIMYSKYKKESGVINFIAYRNSIAFLRNHIEGIYRFAKTKERAAELLEQLDSRLSIETTIINKRRIYAEYVLTLMNWNELQNRQIVPPGLARRDVLNPEVLVSLSVAEIIKQHGDGAKEWLSNRVDELIRQDEVENAERAAAVRKELSDALNESRTTQGDIYLLIRWLYTHYGARNADLLKAGLLPQDYREQSRRRTLRDTMILKLPERVRQKLRTTQG